MATDQTQPSDETRAEEAKEARKDHDAGTVDADGTPPESASPGVAAHEEEMNERGANVKGEGQI